MTVVAVVQLGQLERGGGGGHEHLFGSLGQDGLLYHPALEEVSGQGVGALFQHAPKDEREGVGVVTPYSHASESAVVRGLDGRDGNSGDHL